MFLTVSCSPSTLPATATRESAQSETGDECVPSEAEFDYPIKPPDGSEASPQFAPPPSEWKVQTSLPEYDPKATLQLIEHEPGYDVIWVISGDKYLRFRTDTKQWSSTLLSKDFGINVRSVFQDQSGQVWAFGSFFTPHDFYLRFLRLNDNGQFELVNSPGIKAVFGDILYQTPLVSKDGTFWMMVQDGLNQIALYSFDPNTGEAKPHLSGELKEFGWSIAMGQDGSIFLVRPKERDVVRYHPDTGTSENIVAYDKLVNVNLTDFFYPYLFVDRSGNLWIGDYVWMDFKNLTLEGLPTWHQIIRSPVFIGRYANQNLTFLWIRPRPMLQSSDGRIWFNGLAAGLVWLDPQKGLWCKFTTIDSEILEDRDGNLWLLYDSNLYKYSITP
jgi:hypothetical protein